MYKEDPREKTLKSKNLLELARDYAEKAKTLDENNPERKWLEEKAKELLNRAKDLTEQVKRQVAG